MTATAEATEFVSGGTQSMREIYGKSPRRVPKDREPFADFEERIESIWPFLVRKVAEFLKKLSDADRAALDMDDILSEVWLRLRAKDDRWEPARGRYITFAWAVAGRRMAELRDKSRVVSSPLNCVATICKYQSEEGLSPKRRATLAAMLATRGSYAGLAHDSEIPDARHAVADRSEALRAAVVAALSSLSPYEAALVGQTRGLFRPSVSLPRVARRLKIGREEAERILAEADAKLRDLLRAEWEDSRGD